MAKEELDSQIDFFIQKYGQRKDEIENGLEFLTLHLFAQEKEFAGFLLGGEDPADADLSSYRCAGANDLKIDGLIYSEDLETVAIFQCAHRSKWSTDIEDKAAGFFNSLPNWLDPKIVATGNSNVVELLTDSSLDPERQQIFLYFVTTLAVNTESASKLFRMAEEIEGAYTSRGWRVSCIVMGRSELISKSIELANVRDYGLAQKVTLQIERDSFFEVEEPLPALVCSIKGNAIAAIYNNKSIKNKLFNQNVRLGMTTNINKEIVATAIHDENSKNFFYYNNGITAVCSKYEFIDDNTIEAENLQVVNGAQTVTALARSVGSGGAVTKSTNARVLFRLIATGEGGSRKSELADEITKYQNTQNAVKESDFFSNEPFQLWLSKNLASRLSNKGAIPAFYYQHKRGWKPSQKSGEAITIERLAQLRHAIYYGPAVSYNSPRLFWIKQEPHYWQAFGRKGQECQTWNEEEMAEIGWAIAWNLQLQSIADDLKRRSRSKTEEGFEPKYLGYLSRYVTSIAFQVVQRFVEDGDIPSFLEQVESKLVFDRCSSDIIRHIRLLLMNEMTNTYGMQGNSRLAVARDEKKFHMLKDQCIEAVRNGLVRLSSV
jgi:hypothetical protein